TGLKKAMHASGYEVTTQGRGDEGLAQALEESYDVVITDLKLPGTDGLELVRRLHQAKPKLPIILITAHGSTETAIEATKWGAFDYVPKPFEVEEVLELTAKALESSRLMSEPVDMGEAEPARTAIVGQSRAMQMIDKEIGRIAATPVTVLVRGDTGTGKELIARAIYQHSDRADAPFIAINCAAIPEALLESELFGHERGAFTGADARRIGRFEQAHGGTLFLDEIGDMSPGLQTRLLRVLAQSEFFRVGGQTSIKVDVRVIAATNQDLALAVREGRFRDDLFHRLNVMRINTPPLKERRQDIAPLLLHYLGEAARELDAAPKTLSAEALEILEAYDWPGNVRQL